MSKQLTELNCSLLVYHKNTVSNVNMQALLKG